MDLGKVLGSCMLLAFTHRLYSGGKGKKKCLSNTRGIHSDLCPPCTSGEGSRKKCWARIRSSTGGEQARSCEGTFLPPTQQNGSGLFVFPDANNRGARLVVASIASFPNINYRVLKRCLLIVFIYVQGWDFKLFSTALRAGPALGR